MLSQGIISDTTILILQEIKLQKLQRLTRAIRKNFNSGVNPKIIKIRKLIIKELFEYVRWKLINNVREIYYYNTDEYDYTARVTKCVLFVEFNIEITIDEIFNYCLN